MFSTRFMLRYLFEIKPQQSWLRRGEQVFSVPRSFSYLFRLWVGGGGVKASSNVLFIIAVPSSVTSISVCYDWGGVDT